MNRRELLISASGISLGALSDRTANASSAQADLHLMQWGRAWSVAMQAPDDPVSFPDVTKAFRNQTLRQIVHPTIDGAGVRVWISNEFGTRPLIVGRATLARSGGEDRIIPGTSVELSFGGKRCVSIPPGVRVVSDGASLAIRELESLAISAYLPAATYGTTATVHQDGREWGYASHPGDYCDASGFSGSDPFQARFFVSALDVSSEQVPDALVAIGDSITDGYMSSVGALARYPDALAAKLVASKRRMSVLNLGITGNRLLRDWNGPSLWARFDRDIASIPRVRTVVVLIGINDLGAPGYLVRPHELPSVEELWLGYSQLTARAEDRGVRMIIGTLTPCEGAAAVYPGYSGEPIELLRTKVNELIRERIGSDHLADFDRALRDPDRPSRLLPEFDSGDHLHPSRRGYEEMAEVVYRLVAADG